MDQVVRDVGEIYIAVGRHSRPLGELEAAGQLDRLGSRRNEIRRAAHAWPSSGCQEQ